MGLVESRVGLVSGRFRTDQVENAGLRYGRRYGWYKVLGTYSLGQFWVHMCWADTSGYSCTCAVYICVF